MHIVFMRKDQPVKMSVMSKNGGLAPVHAAEEPAQLHVVEPGAFAVRQPHAGAMGDKAMVPDILFGRHRALAKVELGLAIKERLEVECQDVHVTSATCV